MKRCLLLWLYSQVEFLEFLETFTKVIPYYDFDYFNMENPVINMQTAKQKIQQIVCIFLVIVQILSCQYSNTLNCLTLDFWLIVGV